MACRVRFCSFFLKNFSQCQGDAFTCPLAVMSDILLAVSQQGGGDRVFSLDSTTERYAMPAEMATRDPVVDEE